MQKGKRVSGLAFALCLTAGLAGVPSMPSCSPMFAQVSGGTNAKLAGEIKKQLDGKNFKDVTVLLSNGIATLSGQVDLYAYKASALKKARKVRGVKAVRDNIAVGGPTFADDVLQRKLLSKIEVDRIGFGQVFDAISVQVQNGVVTLGGHALGPVAQQSAVSLTEFTPGVKGVVNQIRIDPVSPFDDGIRRAVFSAIYGFPALQEYAIVPSRPIRISVQNSRVTLYGIVNNQMDSTLAYTRAMQVPNVFHVTNDLVVANKESSSSSVSSSSQ